MVVGYEVPGEGEEERRGLAMRLSNVYMQTALPGVQTDR